MSVTLPFTDCFGRYFPFVRLMCQRRTDTCMDYHSLSAVLGFVLISALSRALPPKQPPYR
jgi:hypothetical protein